MPFPVSVPYTFGTMSGIVPASDFDANFSTLQTALNGINSGTFPLSSVSITGGTWGGSPIGVSYGGTGNTATPTYGQLLIGNGSGFTLSTLTAGPGITISNTSGAITITGNTATGTVTSVNISGGTTGLTATGGPITSSGTITLGGTLAVANGGTGVTTSTGSGNNVLSNSPTLITPALGIPSSVVLTNATGLPVTAISATGSPTSATYLRGDGSWTSISTSVVINTTAISGGVSGRVLYDNAGTVGELANTGTGNNVLATSPTLVTPNLGTPSALTLTNATGLPVSGISATGTPSSTTYLRGDGTWSTISGTGSVTSVAFSGGTTGLTVTGSPITTAGTITLAGTLAVANGGTNLTSYTTGDIIYASATNTLSKLAAGTNGQVLTLAAGVPTWAAGGGGSVGSQTYAYPWFLT